MEPAAQTTASVRKKPRTVCGIAYILAFGLVIPCLGAGEPPQKLAKLVAAAESRNREARTHYTYRQSVEVEELEGRGGQFKEVRDILFSLAGERVEQLIGAPLHALSRLRLTDEDFRDIREVQPFLFTDDQLWAYQVEYKGEENIEGTDCWVLQVKPRQILDGQRLFEGLMWVNQQDYAVVRSEGKAVPDILDSKHENLFPRFTTLRGKVDDRHWFPIYTHAEDTLGFRGGSLKMRMKIQYGNYKRFASDTNITFK